MSGDILEKVRANFGQGEDVLEAHQKQAFQEYFIGESNQGHCNRDICFFGGKELRSEEAEDDII